jgi:membrane protease YdiL (CAAX protease family)
MDHRGHRGGGRLPRAARLVSRDARLGPRALFGHEQHVAGVVVAVLFALAHAANFANRPFLEALGQQLYALALAILYAYWLDRSRSVVAQVVGHNVSNGVEYVLAFALQGDWG